MIDGNPSRAADASSSTKSLIDMFNTLEDSDSTYLDGGHTSDQAQENNGTWSWHLAVRLTESYQQGLISTTPSPSSTYAEDSTCLRGGGGGSADVFSKLMMTMKFGQRSLTTVTSRGLLAERSFSDRRFRRGCIFHSSSL